MGWLFVCCFEGIWVEGEFFFEDVLWLVLLFLVFLMLDVWFLVDCWLLCFLMISFGLCVWEWFVLVLGLVFVLVLCLIIFFLDLSFLGLLRLLSLLGLFVFFFLMMLLFSNLVFLLLLCLFFWLGMGEGVWGFGVGLVFDKMLENDMGFVDWFVGYEIISIEGFWFFVVRFCEYL